jgi:predicted DNA-binding WGR domain protein
MSVFSLPKTLCYDLNSMMLKFWWVHKENEKHIYWMSWGRIGVSKEKGEMGFCDLTCFNHALLAKQFWRLWNTKESLASQIIQEKYYPNNSILGAKLGSKPSFAWRSIHGTCEIVQDGLIWRNGDGKSVNIWGIDGFVHHLRS